jgi:hypothetical protein
MSAVEGAGPDSPALSRTQDSPAPDFATGHHSTRLTLSSYQVECDQTERQCSSKVQQPG